LVGVSGVVPARLSPHSRKILSTPSVKGSLAKTTLASSVALHSLQVVPYPQACDTYLNCWDCLTSSGCLWDPNALGGGSCKPSSQCDFTVHLYSLRVEATVSAPPPATACVRDQSQCGIHDFDGAPLDPNPQRGVGCTNSGQCGSDQYCVDCTKCGGQHCDSMCNGFGGHVSGYCAPKFLCDYSQDSIDNYCPSQVVPSNNCFYNDCSSCAAAPGCVWSGSYCYYATVPCSSPGCANSPNECWGGGYGGSGGSSYGGGSSYEDGYN